MFRRIVNTIPGGANTLFLEHPAVLATILEVAWQFRAHNPAADLGTPTHRSNIPQLPDFWLQAIRTAAGIVPPSGNITIAPLTSSQTVFWDHLIYAFMIENTVIYEIFGRVLHEFLHGEK